MQNGENKMKTNVEIINEFERVMFIAHKFYLNGLLFCLGRADLEINSDERATEKRLKYILEEIRK